MDLVVARAMHTGGALRRAVLLAHGVSRRTIEARLTSGEWRIVLGDVVSLSPTFPSVAARVAAVGLLAPVHRFVGDVADAAWNLIEDRAVSAVVAEIPRNGRAIEGDGVSLVRTRVTAADIGTSPVVRGLRVTTEEETLRARAARLRSRAVDELVTDYLRRHRGVSDLLWQACGRGRQGSSALRASLLRVDDGHWSHPERVVGRGLARRGVDLVPNFRVRRPATGEVAIIDLYDERRRRGVEVDGWTFHTDPVRFAADRRRDLWLETECGIRILRVAAVDVVRQEARTVDGVYRWLTS